MSNPILAGIPAGGMKELYEVKILICYLLDTVATPLTREDLCEICCGDNLVDYFTLCTALQELEQNGNITPMGLDEESAYILAPLGRETVNNLKKALPSSLRDEIVTRGMNILARRRRENEITTAIRSDGSGYQVRCVLHDGMLDFFSLSFYAPDLEQAKIIEKKLQRNTSGLYERLIKELTE